MNLIYVIFVFLVFLGHLELCYQMMIEGWVNESTFHYEGGSPLLGRKPLGPWGSHIETPSDAELAISDALR